MKNILCLLLVATLLVACEEENNQNNAGQSYTTDSFTEPDTNAVMAMPSDTVFYEIKGYDKKISGCQSDTANCASFYATFPLIEPRLHGKVSDSINNFIREKIYAPLYGDARANGLNDLLDPYFTAYKAAMQEQEADGQDYTMAWYYSRVFSVVHNNYWLFTIAHHEKSYAGGAHPNSFTNYYNFNPVTGQRLFLHSILKQGNRQKLTQIAEKKFRKKMNISPTASLEDEGFLFEDNRFYLNENFWLDDEGLHFLYNPYEVAPYAVGPINLTITYGELNGMLQDIFDPENRLAFDKNHTQVGRY